MALDDLTSTTDRIILKSGTASITTDTKLDIDSIKNIVENIYNLKESGFYVAHVTSGAIAEGRRELNEFEEGDIVDKQAYAAVGQPSLMECYREQFGRYRMNAAQLLVSKSDFKNKNRFNALHNVFFKLLYKGIVPILNENDTVSTKEIRFTDNDELEALTAINLLRECIMFNLIRHDGLLKKGKVVKIATSYIKKAYDNLENETREGRGGLQGKLDAIKIANDAGIICIVGNVMGDFYEMLKGNAIHTRFLPKGKERF